MIALLAALFVTAQPAEPVRDTAAPAEPVREAAPPLPPKPPADITNAVDANGVPAWAKRKPMAPVQNCTGRPNILVESWRSELDPNSKTGGRRNVPIKTTCKR